MGKLIRVACHDCQIQRDLGKFYTMMSAVNSREGAQSVGQSIRNGDYFKAGLLATFMWEHKGHHCTILDDTDELRYAEEWDRNLWGVDPLLWSAIEEDFLARES